jgi:hypothetical protein
MILWKPQGKTPRNYLDRKSLPIRLQEGSIFHFYFIFLSFVF